MICIYGDGNINFLDLTFAHGIHVLNYYTLLYECNYYIYWRGKILTTMSKIYYTSISQPQMNDYKFTQKAGLFQSWMCQG